MQLFDDSSLALIRKSLLQRKETLAVAESVTSGGLQMAFSTVKDASGFYQGGITAYNLGQKYKHLHVEPIHALECNCVAQRVANEMALHVCCLFESDWGLGITGYAAPVKESNHRLFAYFAIACRGDIVAGKKLVAPEADSFAVQLFYTNQVLGTLQKHLAGKAG